MAGNIERPRFDPVRAALSYCDDASRLELAALVESDGLKASDITEVSSAAEVRALVGAARESRAKRLEIAAAARLPAAPPKHEG